MSAIIIFPKGDDLHVIVPVGRPKAGVHWTSSTRQPTYLVDGEELLFSGFATNDTAELISTPFENGDQLREAFVQGLVDDVIVYDPSMLPETLRGKNAERLSEMAIIRGNVLITYHSEGLEQGDTFGLIYPLDAIPGPIFLGLKGKLVDLFYNYGGLEDKTDVKAVAQALLDLGKAAQVQGHNIDHTLYSAAMWHILRDYKTDERRWETIGLSSS